MPLMEVDEADYNVKSSAKALFDRIGNNPKTRAGLHALIKEVDPSVVIPEYEAKQAALSETESLRKEIDGLKKGMSEKEEAAQQKELEKKFESIVRDGRSKLRKLGYTDEGIEAVEKLMEAEGLANYDHAEAVYAKKNPAKEEMVAPVNFSKAWDIAKPAESDADHKLLMSDPDAFSRKMVNEVLNEFRAPNWRDR